VRFSPDQASSFMDKMRMLFPETAAQTEADDAESEGAAQEPAPEASADDSVAAVAEPQDAPAPAAPALEFDLAPAAKALAALGAPTVAADERVPLKVRVAQEEGEFKLTVPRAAVELLKSLKPLLAVLAKLGG